MAQVLRPLQEIFDPAEYPDLLVGLSAPDDAAVLRLDSERALIFTVDFFTPIVDDPRSYGMIAAANALSDVYAMGGSPVLALNIAAFPDNLPMDILAAILRGSAEKVREAGAFIAGGHTIKDKEPKVGLAVIGFVDPDNLLTKSGAKPGDILALTKPLGTGTIATAGKNDRASPQHIQSATQWMTQLNNVASKSALKAKAHAMTDITGFGLLGHVLEMAEPSQATFQLQASAIPFMDGAQSYGKEWIFPDGSHQNKLAFETKISFDAGISPEIQMLLFDAQTSGGLLIALPPANVDLFAEAMQHSDRAWWKIGQVIERARHAIEVLA